jgi:cytochrome b6-f complex subunit 5
MNSLLRPIAPLEISSDLFESIWPATIGKAIGFKEKSVMVEPILLGIVLGLVPVTLAGLFVAAYMQYRRSNQFE